jgi:hypothetical protein
MVTHRQIHAGAVALLKRAALNDGVVVGDDVLEIVPADVADEALQDATTVLEAAEKASLIIIPGEVGHG